ncbi:MAG: hypothetical protein E7525_03745 [Ruminococcaceae bacterium]|nr:hypothetical protein [Oscillospiraceae bacterium]
MKKILSIVMSIAIIFGMFVGIDVSVLAASATTPTGYTSASDVDYNIVSNAWNGKSIVANWGAHEELATFLTTYANSYYTGNYTYDKLSLYSGGTTQSNAQNSDLHEALQDMMTAKHHTQNNYDANKTLLKYADCVRGDTSKICFFYSATLGSSTWDGGSTWNREHTWPNSKGDESRQEDDVMMIRPALSRENSSRGNTAYGESSNYYDPGENFRGDCARIVLYVYTRWGNSTIYSKMWGTSGVMENMDVLLRWMEEDPVDTWELGRNDAVQSMTGVRNVFVDYPEFAFLMFGQEIPDDMPTPSGIASGGNSGVVTPNTVTFGGETVNISGGKVTVPATAGYFTDTNGKLYFPGQEISVTAGQAFTAAPIATAADNAFSFRNDGTIGIRARGALPASVVGTASEIGFIVAPLSASDISADWYISSQYAVKTPIKRSTIYADAVEIDGYQYQICLKDLSESVINEYFLFVIYATVDGVTTYTYIGCQSFKSIPGATTGKEKEATVNFYDENYANGADFSSVTFEDVTVSAVKNNGSTPPRYYATGTAIRIYGKNTLTVSVPTGYKIDTVVFTTAAGNHFKTNTQFSTGTVSGVGTATTTVSNINGTKLTITNPDSSGHYRIQEITVTYKISN